MKAPGGFLSLWSLFVYFNKGSTSSDYRTYKRRQTMKKAIASLGLSVVLLITFGINVQAQPKQLIELGPDDFGIHALWPQPKAQPKQVIELGPDDFGIHALWPNR